MNLDAEDIVDTCIILIFKKKFSKRYFLMDFGCI